jgi:hypothetical protein
VVTVPTGTRFWVALQQPISSAFSRSGEPVLATLLSPLVAEGVMVASKGMTVRGRVVSVSTHRRKGFTNTPALLKLEFTSIELPAPWTPLVLQAGVESGAVGKQRGIFSSQTYDAVLKTQYQQQLPSALPYLNPRLRGLTHEVELQGGQPLLLMLNQPLHVGGRSAPYRLLPPQEAPSSTSPQQPSPPPPKPHPML